MSEEEKQAIEMLEKFITEHKFYNIKQSDDLELNIKKVLNLLEKQQKEIDELKNMVDRYKNVSDVCIGLFQDIYEKNYISKDKIREKIKELEEKQQKLNKEAAKDKFLNIFERNLTEVSHIIYTKYILKELLGEVKDE